MKKLFFASISVFFSVFGMAQNGKVISAYNYIQAYNGKEGPSNLEEGAKAIDQAITDPTTSGSTKTWWYRSQIYQFISLEPSLLSKYPMASIESMKSFQKMQELNDPKFKDWADATQNIKALTNDLFNDGVEAFNAKKYTDAYAFFNGIADAVELLKTRGEKVGDDLLPKALGNAALAAENAGDNNQALAAYKKLLPISNDSKVYQSLINLNKKMQNIGEAKRLTDEALVKYPNDKEILINKINFYIADGKQADAIQYLKKAADQDPKNEQIQAALGLSYDQSGDTVNARKVYENLLTMNPNNFEGNYGLGAMIFNRSKPVQEKMNTLGYTKADQVKYEEFKVIRNSLFGQAKGYLDKAKSLQPDNQEVKKALNTIDAMTKQ